MDNTAIFGNDMGYTDDLIIAIVMRLIEEAPDDFWKVLKYATKDATTNPAYTVSEDDKYNMVAQNTDGTRILLQRYNDDITTQSHNELRIFESKWDILKSGQYDLHIGFECISHNSIAVLNDNRKPINIIRNTIYKLFNGRTLHKSSGMVTNEFCQGYSMLFNSGYQGYYFALKTFSS